MGPFNTPRLRGGRRYRRVPMSYAGVGPIGLLASTKRRRQRRRGKWGLRLKAATTGEGISYSSALIRNRCQMTSSERFQARLIPDIKVVKDIKVFANYVIGNGSGTSASTTATGQFDYASPNQGCFLSYIFTKAEIPTIWQNAVAAVTQLSTTPVFQASFLGLQTGTSTWDQIVNNNSSDDVVDGYQQRLLLSDINVTDTIINTCSYTQEFKVYILGTRVPFGDGVAVDLGALLDANIRDPYGADAQADGTTSMGTTANNYNKLYPQNYGWNPMSYGFMRYYYKTKKCIKFVLKPGETKKIRIAIKGKYMVNGLNYLSHSEIPGLTHAIFVIAGTQLVGSNLAGSTSNVGHGDGQFQHTRFVGYKAKVVPRCHRNITRYNDLDTIAFADQEVMNPETNRGDQDPARL